MKIYMAAVEDTWVVRVMSDPRWPKGACGFSSYWTMCKSKALLKSALAGVRPYLDRLVCDSGAHSFFAQRDDIHAASNQRAFSRDTSTEDPKKYAAGYFDWLEEHIDELNGFVELDIGEVVGQKQVYKWRDELVKRGLAHKAWIVYHPKVYRSINDFVSEASQWPSRYTGIEGMRGGRVLYDFNAVIKPLYDKGIKVHGFAMTKSKMLAQVPFASVDSSSWKSGIRYGVLNGIRTGNHCAGRSVKLSNPNAHTKNTLATISVEHGFDMATLLLKPTGSKMTQMCQRCCVQACNTVELQDYWTRYWKLKGVDWDGQDQVRQTKGKARG